nr:substrate-binding domain-containing protein [Anaerolineae bacterium]
WVFWPDWEYEPADEEEAVQYAIQMPEYTGTHRAYLNLIEGKRDFILVIREPDREELDAAETLGVELVITPIALDAFVFVVNISNPLTGLTIQQARDIYAGTITNWADVGGENAPIHLYGLTLSSESEDLMEALVMQGTPLIDVADMVEGSSGGPFHFIGGFDLPMEPGPFRRDDEDLLGIGYTLYYHTVTMQPNQMVKMMEIDGIAPTGETIEDWYYPLTTQIYAVIPGGAPVDSPATRLRDWLLSEEGRAVIALSGYVPWIGPPETITPAAAP